ncbi:elongin-C-like isoform X4 [Xyrauchen texanus]|uniref:elongin-C-like isoform X4 n=1 Tax=Xyrauchen texanus TaxID=154827 RepID=UPI0022425C2B|nr:elongin-C-like isoform X4 [Xyrauchen texanus]
MDKTVQLLLCLVFLEGFIKYLFYISADVEERIYGGCEGPDAMHVKLISTDGHEFIVKREHALTSGTIKAMLSGPGQFAENETNELNRNSRIPHCS